MNAKQEIDTVISKVAEFAHQDTSRAVVCIMATEKDGIGACVGGHLVNLSACIAGLMRENSHFAEAVEKAYLHHKFGKNGNTGN